MECNTYQVNSSYKAKYFGDHEAYNQIMGCSTSLECKRASRLIRNVEINKWDMVAGDLCQPGIQSKFLQNPPIMDTLLWTTGQKTIVECTLDRLWGTGIPLNDSNCLDSSKWISQGIMGQILEGMCNNVLAHFLKRVIKNVQSHDFYRVFKSF